MTERAGDSCGLECRTPDQKTPTLAYELELLATAKTVIGMDEVGRGAIAGPVAVGTQVVTLEMPDPPEGLKDSKLLTEKRREALAPVLDTWGVGAVGYASAAEIDADGISAALGTAGVRALAALWHMGVDLAEATVIVDGKHDWLSPALPSHLAAALTVVTRVGADRGCVSVAAASVRAKVARDRLMRHHHLGHSAYAWDRNKGYGAKAHYEGIAAHGLTPLHRASWIRRDG